MSHFAFEQQLSDAVRMDTSIHVNMPRSVVRNGTRQSLKPTSRLNISGLTGKYHDSRNLDKK